MSTTGDRTLEDLSSFLERRAYYQQAEKVENSIFGVKEYNDGSIELYDKLTPETPLKTYESCEELLEREAKEVNPEYNEM